MLTVGLIIAGLVILTGLVIAGVVLAAAWLGTGAFPADERDADSP